ncbi:MAG TPA: 16S rRNA methyltransferase, partial [Halothiobacillaceae bacterium]|nr:16S rRNA methyltransferase [Halothiobacillaceae bacterium]
QRRLVDEALSLLPAVGRIVYSTCSLLSAENEQCVQWMLQRYPHVQVAQTRLTLPSIESESGVDDDGGYVAVLTGPAPSANQ